MAKDTSNRWDYTASTVGEWSMEMEYWWNDTDKENQSTQKKQKLSRCRFVHHKWNTTLSGNELGALHWDAGG